ncbi:cyclin G [Ooceraea biroi]|nr:cyclin G [Ooceraea biroi]XP_011333791.1 cyclin G [Ooceraea biroi]
MSHTAGMDTSGSPVPDAIPLEKLQEDLIINLIQEVKFQPNLHELSTATQEDEITMNVRDKSASVLRCLKVLYDSRSDVFFMAINLMDCFLTKVKARQRHMACISVCAFYMASRTLETPMDIEHLISISQCRCTADDLKRMRDKIEGKLEWASGTQPITALTFLRLFNDMFHAVAAQLRLGDLYASLVVESKLEHSLEMVACNGDCSSFKPSEIALVLLCIFLDDAFRQLDASGDVNVLTDGSAIAHRIATTPAYQILKNGLARFIVELRRECNISEKSFHCTREAVDVVLNKYNAEEQTPHRQNLIWRLSSRTASILRPTDGFISVLPAIAEHAPLPPSNRIRKSHKKNRSTRRQRNKRR